MNFLVLQVFYAIFSGAAQALSISNELFPFGNPLVGLVALAPLYLAFYTSRSFGRAFLIGFIQTFTVHMASSFWLANFHGFAVFTLGASALGTAAQGGLTFLILFSFPAFFTENGRLRESALRNGNEPSKRILWFSAGIVAWEFAKSTGTLAYPWGTLSMSAYLLKAPVQIASVTGVWGITFLMALASSLLGEVILSFRRRTGIRQLVQPAKFILAAWAFATVIGAFPLIVKEHPEKQMNIVMVQQNADPWEKGETSSIEISKRLTEEGISQLEKQGLLPDLVVWSEGILTKSFPLSRFFYETNITDDKESLSAFIGRIHAPFLIGGMTRIRPDRRGISNSAVLFDSEGKYSGFYSKMQLVPFAEYIPFSDNPLMKHFINNVVGLPPSLVRGIQHVVFKVPLRSSIRSFPPLEFTRYPEAHIELDTQGLSNPETTAMYREKDEFTPENFVSFSAPICFEDAFPSVCGKLHSMGSEVFMNITNDSWSKTRSAEMQHFVVASYLAIEYRTTLVRCTNSGYSAVVDPDGRIVHELPLFKETSCGISVPVYRHRDTFYSRFGDWFALCCIIAVLGWTSLKALAEKWRSL